MIIVDGGENIMKKSFGGFDIEISDWTPKLKIATIVFAAIAFISSVRALISGNHIPGLIPLTIGVTMLLLGIRELNLYFKEKKSKVSLMLGILLTLLFAFNLYLGIDQILTQFTFFFYYL